MLRTYGMKNGTGHENGTSLIIEWHPPPLFLEYQCFPFPFLFLSASFRWRLTSSIDDPFGMFGLPTAEIGDDFVQTVVVLRDVLVADSPDFLDDLIAVHG